MEKKDFGQVGNVITVGKKNSNPLTEFWRRVFGIEYAINYYTIIAPKVVGYKRREAGTYEWTIVRISPHGKTLMTSDVVKRKATAVVQAELALEKILNGET